MINDLFVSLDYNHFAEVLESLEGYTAEMIACRHDYPIWPAHGDNPSDYYEEEFHGMVRRPYYYSTIKLIHALRELRELS